METRTIGLLMTLGPFCVVMLGILGFSTYHTYKENKKGLVMMVAVITWFGIGFYLLMAG